MRVWALLGVAFFFSLPFAMLAFYRLEDRHLSREREIAVRCEEARNLLGEMVFSCSRDFQVKRMFLDFHRQVGELVLNATFTPELAGRIRDLHRQEILPSFPRHHLWLQKGHQNASGTWDPETLFVHSDRPDFAGQVAMRFWRLVQDENEPPPDWRAATREILTGLLRFPFQSDLVQHTQFLIAPRDEGCLQVSSAVDAQTGLFWYFPKGGQTRLLVGVVYDDETIPSRFEIRQMFRMYADRPVGMGFCPHDATARIQFSDLLATATDLLGFVTAEIRGKRIVQFEATRGDRFICAAPNLVGQPGNLFVVQSLAWKGEAARHDLAFFAVLLLAWGSGSALLLRKLLRGRGPRLKVDYAMLFAFFSVTFLPFFIARGLVADWFAEERTRGRGQAVRDLHDTLRKMDDGFLAVGAEQWYRFKEVGRRPEVVAAFARDLAPQPARDLLEHLYRITRVCYPMGANHACHVQGLVASGPFQVGMLRTGTKGEARQKGEAMIGDLFGPLLRKIMARANGRRPGADPPGEGASPKPTLDGLTREMTDDVTTDLLRAMLGGLAFYTFLADPAARLCGQTFSVQLNLGLSPVVRAGGIQAMFIWFWSWYNLEEEYLNMLMGRKPFVSHPDLDLMTVRKNEFLGWAKMPRRGAVPAAMWHLIDRARRVETPQVSFDLEDSGQTVMEVFPGRNLMMVLLGGFYSLERMLGEQRFRERLSGVAGLLFVVVAILVVFLVKAHFMRPLAELGAGIREVDAQRYDRRLDETRGDEFGSLAAVFNVMVKGLREGSILGRYVSSAVQAVVKDQAAFRRAQRGENREMTVLFSALHGFGEITAGGTPRAVFDLLGRHLQACSDAVKRHGGVIDKVIGEKVMIFFDHATLGGGPATLARALAVVADIRRGCAGLPTRPVIGLASGVVMAGILGAREVHLDYTVIGDTVNLAARLTAMAHEVGGTGVVLGGATRRFADPAVPMRLLGQTRVKGKTEEIEAWLLLDGPAAAEAGKPA